MCVENCTLRFGRPEPGKGQVIWLVGPNKSGKSSTLEGVRLPFTGGSRPDLIRDGADKMTAVMRMWDGVKNVKITRTQTVNGSYLKIETEDGVVVKSPQAYVAALGASVGLDPLKFVAMKKEDRLKYLLTVMPMNFTQAEVGNAMGLATTKLAESIWTQIKWFNNGESTDIEGVNRLIRELTEMRARIGSQRDENAGAGERLRKTLLVWDQGDGGPARDWRKELELLEANKAAIEKERDGEVDEIQAQLRRARDKCSLSILLRDGAARDEFAAALEAAHRGDSEVSLDNIATNLSSIASSEVILRETAADAQAAIDKCRSEASSALEGMASSIQAARSAIESQAGRDGVREQMEMFRKQAQKMAADWDALKAAIAALDDLRLEKLKALPIDGIDIRDGDIFFDGRQFDLLNTADRYLKAISIGVQGIGDSNLMTADDAEHLDADNRAWFEEAVINSGVNMICTRVATKEEVQRYGPALRSEPAGALVVAVLVDD
jgi:hypothetical protein